MKNYYTDNTCCPNCESNFYTRLILRSADYMYPVEYCELTACECENCHFEHKLSDRLKKETEYKRTFYVDCSDFNEDTGVNAEKYIRELMTGFKKNRTLDADFKLGDELKLNFDLADIDNVLSEAREYKLETEVVWSALTAMKDNPNLSIKDAINIGYREWVK